MSSSDGKCGGGCGGAKRYHHGSLREALIDGAYRQICECGIEKLSIARLCKALGVSSAAPYRHFDDRDELIGEVSARGFRALGLAMQEALNAHPPGSLEGLVALGKAYIRFVAEDPEMFHVMWGMTREKVHNEVAYCAGRDAFDVLIGCVREIQNAKGLGHLDTITLALPIWSGVHGLATLHVGERLRVAEGVDIEDSVELATRVFFAGLEAMAARQTVGDADAAVAAPS